MADPTHRRRRDDMPRPSAPPIHGSHWRWLVVAYFFLGGISAGAQVLASLADLSGKRGLGSFVRTARYLSFVAFLPCPPLLILDLQRPERFLNMLRVLKLRSPMSIGSWALVAFGGVAALGALAEAAKEKSVPAPLTALRNFRLSKVLSVLGLPSGLLLAGYTGVLLAATAVPLWTKRALLLGPLFLASALSTAAAALDLTGRLSRVGDANNPALHRIERFTLLSEALLLLVWLARRGRAGHPLAIGPLARWLHHGVAGLGLALPAVLSATAPFLGPRARLVAQAAGALATLVGGFILRTTVILGGNQSAADAEATFEMTALRRADLSAGG